MPRSRRRSGQPTGELQGRLATIARETVANPDAQASMQLIVDRAREWTGASSAVLSLMDKSGAFAQQASSPKSVDLPEPRTTGGVGRALLEKGQPIRIADTMVDLRVRVEVRQQVRSLVGVPVSVDEERIGVLFVHSDRADRFNAKHEKLLVGLADCAAVAFGWWRAFIEPADEVARALARLIQFDEIARDVCQEIKRDFGFDFVALQLSRKNERMLETVASVGLEADEAAEWRHSLDDPEDVQDLQVSIYSSCNAEVIHGFDPRCDPWIYKTCGHEHFSRVFLPLMTFRDAHGGLEGENLLEFGAPVPLEANPASYRMTSRFPKNAEHQVIGTLDAGYKNPRAISPETVERLGHAVARVVPRIWQAMLPHVLEAILEHVVQLLRADSATLHFAYEPVAGRYAFEFASRNPLARRLLGFPPRADGLGRGAIRDGKPGFITGAAQLATDNPALFGCGVASIAAFPIRIGESAGVLYTHFKREHRFTQNETGWLKLLSRTAEDALRHATAYAELREQATKLETMPRILSGVATAEDPLERLAQDTRYLLGADVVTLYEYFQGSDRFLTPPTRAGRLRQDQEMLTPIRSGDVPMLLVRSGHNIYEQTPKLNKKLMGSREGKLGESFVWREGIEAVAAVILRTGKEIVGTMFVSYRRIHAFPAWERRMLETLAAAAATTILNRRLAESTQMLATLGDRAGRFAHELQGELGRVGAWLGSSPKAQEALDAAKQRVEEILRWGDEPWGELDLCKTVEEALKRLDAPTELHVINEVDARLPPLVAGEAQMTSIFTELLRNAKEAMPDGGVIKVSAEAIQREKRRFLEARVSDTGPGVPLDLRRRVFDRSYTTRPSGSGGFGLWWVRMSVRRLGGDIWFDEPTDRGGLVVLRLPLNATNGAANDAKYSGL